MISKGERLGTRILLFLLASSIYIITKWEELQVFYNMTLRRAPARQIMRNRIKVSRSKSIVTAYVIKLKRTSYDSGI